MRRWAFYMSVALTAFALGSIIAAEFRHQCLPPISQLNQSKFLPTEHSDILADLKMKRLLNQPEVQPAVKKRVAFTCNDKILSAVLNDSRKDRDFNEDFLNYLDVREDASNCHDILSIKQSVDLNGDGIKEFIVTGNSSLLCGGTGNCRMWIYEKSGNGYKKLLEIGGELLIIRQTVTNNYKDIFVRDHESGYESYQSTYKFSKGKYQENKCLFVDDGFAGNKLIMTCAEKQARSKEE